METLVHMKYTEVDISRDGDPATDGSTSEEGRPGSDREYEPTSLSPLRPQQPPRAETTGTGSSR